MSRIKVTSNYRNPSTVELVEDDGSFYMTLKEGQPFRIGNQMRSWIPVRIPHKSGKGTVLECRKYRDDGTVLESFVIPNHKTGLWATSSGSARNGVFHRYHEPADKVQALCRTLGSFDCHRVNKIDVQFYESDELEVELYDGKGLPINGCPNAEVEGGSYLFLKREEGRTWAGGKERPQDVFTAYYTADGVNMVYDLIQKYICCQA